VEVESDQADRIALGVAAAAVSYDVIAVPVLPRAEASPTPAELIVEHQERRYPLVAVAFIGLIGVLRIVRSRRDRAVYRLLAFGRADLFVMGLLDYVICFAVPLCPAFVVAVLVGEMNDVSTQVLAAPDLVSMSLASAGLSLVYGAMWASGRNRHQFAPGA
jgi:hypothetical protein